VTKPIEDYAIIGDCRSAALVGCDGSIDWLCWPRFDSDACFAALLGDSEHGRWLIAPVAAGATVERRYRDDSLTLETSFATDGGAVDVIDFMPTTDGRTDLVRSVVGRRGRVTMHSGLMMRFGYGARRPLVSRIDDHTLRLVSGPDMAVLRSDAALRVAGADGIAEFTVEAGQRVSFVLSWAPSHAIVPPAIAVDAALRETSGFWAEWAARCNYDGEFRAPVMRSLLTLKALTYRPTGGIVAAPTTSLPEHLGGPRNWDYRYCWLRDASLTIGALAAAGYHDEGIAWRDWLVRTVGGDPAAVQIMYGIAGESRLAEWEIDWLPGYEGSRPVRVGNAAVTQLQVDVFGEVLESLHGVRAAGAAECADGWRLERDLVAQVERVWHVPDQGIWEMRGAPQHFTHSKVMAWVALDRAIHSATDAGLEAPIARWSALRARMHAEICERAFDRGTGSFMQAYGSPFMDASLLMLPLVGFLPPNDPRIVGTVRLIEERLLIDGLVYRYNSARVDDGLPAGEGAFLACSFWLADTYLMQDRPDDAHALFERLLGLVNDVGLLAEEYHPGHARQLGNFPQAFSHVGLVETARNLQRHAAHV
jgi:GH15 family glucan-1,4-alpha-glucosidase